MYCKISDRNTLIQNKVYTYSYPSLPYTKSALAYRAKVCYAHSRVQAFLKHTFCSAHVAAHH